MSPPAAARGLADLESSTLKIPQANVRDRPSFLFRSLSRAPAE